jgi:hypothetical protein
MTQITPAIIQRSFRWDRLSTTYKNDLAALIIPVVQNLGEHVRITSSRHCSKDVPTNAGQAVGKCAAARTFLEELESSRKAEYAASEQRLGIPGKCGPSRKRPWVNSLSCSSRLPILLVL